MNFRENRLVFLAQDQDDSPEQPQLAPEETLAEEREDVIAESQLDRVDMLLEQKETTEQVISEIDINLPTEKQQDAIDTLESTCHIMLAKLFQKKDVDVEEVKTNISLIEQTPGKNRAEKAAIKKINEILENSDCAMFLWLSEWKDIVDMSHQTYEFAKDREEEIRETKGKKGVWGNRILTAGLVVGGAVAGYHLVKWLWKKTKKQRTKAVEAAKEKIPPETVKKAGWFAKALGVSGGVAGALGIATIGACLLSPDKIGKWVSDNLGVDFSKESFGKAWKLIKDGKIWEALKAFSASVEVHHPFIAEAAEKIGMDPKNLLLLKDVKYKKFMSLGEQISRGTDAALSFFISDVELPFVYSGKEKTEALKDEQKLFKFLKAHAAHIEDIEPKETIEDVLKGLDEKGILDEFEANEDEGEGDEDAEKGPDLLRKAPHVKAAIDKAKERLANGEGLGAVAGDLANELITGAVEDGGALAVGGGGVFFFQAGRWVLITAINPIVQATIAAVSTRDPLKTFTAYWTHGGATFTAIGATAGLVKGLATRGVSPFVAVDVVAGAGKGLLAPGKIAWETGRYAYRGGEEVLMMSKRGKNAWYVMGEQFTPTEAQKIEWHHQRAKYHAEQYRKYYDVIYAEKSQAGKGEKLKAKIRRHKWMQKRWIENSLDYHGRKFLEATAEYRKSAGLKALGEEVAWETGNKASHLETAKESNKFLEGGKFEKVQIASETEIEAMARKMAKESGKPENQWEDYRKDAREKVEREKLQPKPRKEPTAEARSRMQTAKEAPIDDMMKGRSRSIKHLELAEGLTVGEAEAIQKLSKLGVTDDALYRMKELGWGEKELASIARKLESGEGSLMHIEGMMKEEMIAKYKPYLKKIAKYGEPIVVLAVLYGYDKADDKVEYLAKTGVEFGAFATGAKITHMTVGNKLMGKGWYGTVGALILDLAGGSAAALGVDKVWDETGGFLLDRYYPDREYKQNDYGALGFGRKLHAEAALMSFGGEGLFNSAMFVADGALTVGHRTDPVAYLQKEMKFVNVYSKEWHKGMFKDYEIHNIETMEKKASKTLERKRNKLEKKEAALAEAETTGDTKKAEKLMKKIEELKEQIEYVEKLADGSWIGENIVRLSLNQELFLRPAYEEFRRLAEAKVEGGGETLDEMMKDMLSDNPTIRDDKKRREVWSFLLKENVGTVEGKNISFRDFIAQAKLVEDRLEFLEGYAPPELRGHPKLIDES